MSACRYQNGITRTELALEKAIDMFGKGGVAPDARKVLIVVTDGQTTPLEGVKGLDLLRDPIQALKVKLIANRVDFE